MTPKYIAQRPLGMFEKNQLAKQLTGGYRSVTLTAILNHPPRSSALDTNFYRQHLYATLTKLIQDHPMLQLTVQDVNKPTVHFVQLTSLKLADLVHVTDQDEYWNLKTQGQIITEECQHEFDLFALRPLWRLRVSCHPDRLEQCSITLSLQHVIADGLSAVVIWKDILHHLNHSIYTLSSNQDNNNITAALFDTSDACEVPLPIELRNGPKDISVSSSDTMPSDGWQGDFPAPENEQLDTVLYLAQVGRQTWEALVRKAKVHKVSMHAVVYAAYLLSWMECYPNQAVKTATAINCRSYCQPQIPENELGIFFGRYECGWPLEKLQRLVDEGTTLTTTFWKLAKEYHYLVQENKLLTCQRSLLMDDLMATYPDSYFDAWYNCRKNFAFGRSGGLNISDLGRFNFVASKDNTWNLQHIWFAQSAHFYATVLAVNVITANDIMHAAITWQRGSVIEEKARQFIDVFISHFESEAVN